MREVAEIIRRHGAALRAALGTRLLPGQARALRDLVACRTAACGGQHTQCTACGGEVYRYHSYRNRHCPKCGGDQTARWLERHRARLQIADIDSGRMLLHIHGKGKRDRYVPLPTPILPRLRDYWCTHRSREWLFPAPTRRGLAHSLAHQGGPVTRSSLQSAFRRAVLTSGIAKHASVHTLRHSYASHLHAAGVSLRLIQEILGHQSLRTTQIYTHLTPDVHATLTDPLTDLMHGL